MPLTRRSLLTVSQWAAGAWLLAGWRAPAPADVPGGPVPAGDAHGAAAPQSKVSVVIPARDEALAVPLLLASLAALDRPPGEVIVVDDHSSDGTPDLARAAGATVLAAPPLPEGWSGKCWALHLGQAAAGGELLVFLDADVTLAADGLGRIAGEHHRMGGLGIVSAEPYHRTLRPYEQLSAVANVVALMGTGAFTGAATSRRRARRGEAVLGGQRYAMAFGPCLAIDRATYDLVGGHAHPDVRSKITEDLAMARRVAAAGRPVRVFAGGGAVAFRMYPGGLRQLVDGWTKVLATGAGGGPPWGTAAVAWWVTGAILASWRGARAGWRGGRAAWGTGGRRRAGRQVAADAAVYAAWAAQMAWHFRRVGRFGALTAAAFPLPLAAFVGCFARSAVKVGLGRPLAWRGRALTGR